MSFPDKLQVIQIVTKICQKHRCQIQEIDFDNKILNIEGPSDDPEARTRCVKELEEMLELYYQQEDEA